MQKKVTDHLGRTIEFSSPPKRITSLAPGITDTLYSLNLEEEVVGRTRYCIHPKEAVQQAETVGGTKRIMLDKIQALKPDLIFAEKEENTKEIVETLEKEFPVFVAEVQSVPEAYRMISDVGAVTDRQAEAEKLAATIQKGFQSLPVNPGKRIAYVIWKNPYMAAGNHTYIHSLFETMGFVNVFSHYEGRYPVVTEENFKQAELDYVFLATEPFPFKEEHIKEFSNALPNATVMSIDGEMFWYGPRMVEAARYFRKVLG
ncbi:iron ABC transporter substrate-binding protein [Virgibacillus indicus]|uniref:Iron ABC transporter substrate-binding protein n=1 Tax=Virgibacillus indicus TaxID=2024554 RepID=A0A265N4S7_9BACI|nr:iron ABC transporter substrate-binding protein [Virgibacillus indicus]